MKLYSTLTILAVLILPLSSCRNQGKKDNNINVAEMNNYKSTYRFNIDFLKEHTGVIELKKGNAALAVIPAWQGRVMTSTADGDDGFSFGWINHDLISSGKISPHINAFGGEERLWLGPEGGQYSIFFRKGAKFVYDEWQTPAFMDTMPFIVVNSNDTSVLLSLDTETVNYTGTHFLFRLQRKITMLNETEIKELTGIETTGLKCVAYSSENSITNTGTNEWNKETGLLSIWMLGMFNPSPAVVITIPYNQGDPSLMGPAVNDNYFGKIPADRLKVTNSHIFFRADGKSRGKIGLPPLRAKGVMGSYDSVNNALTLLFCNVPEGITDYVNSAWEIQEKPYSGDALNSYNDGPLEDGTQMGPFYELETSSPAAALKPDSTLVHRQVTLHITGDVARLDQVSGKVLGASLEDIKSAFNGK